MDKKIIRSNYLKKRSAIPLHEKTKMDEAILEHAKAFSERYSTFAIYHSFKSEVATHSLISYLLDQGKVVACPIIKEGVMHFIEIRHLNDLERGHFGVMEPKEGPYMDPMAFDCIFIPMAAYNDNYYRVGYGKGYYDRYLRQTTGVKCGLAYSLQHVSEMFQEDSDVAFDVLITERGRA